jgi:hypothetical protein
MGLFSELHSLRQGAQRGLPQIPKTHPIATADG